VNERIHPQSEWAHDEARIGLNAASLRHIVRSSMQERLHTTFMHVPVMREAVDHMFSRGVVALSDAITWTRSVDHVSIKPS